MRRVLPLLLLLLVFSSAAGAGEPRDILLLNSYHSLMRWGDEIIAGVSKEFPRETAAETLHVEYLDTKRLDPAEIFPAAAEYLGWKYSSRQPELIIAGDDNALDFLARYRSEVFPGIPVIFTGINRNRQSVDAFTDSWAAGTIEMPDFSGTIEMARSLVPDLAAIAVVTDATSTAYRNLRLLDALASGRFSAIRFEHFHDLPSEELARRLEAMPDSSAVLYISYIRNSTGELFSYNDGLSFVHQHTDAPVFVVWDFLLGEGTAVGGSVLRGKDVGAAAAQGARIYLETGELSRANEIPGPEPVLMLDYTLVRERGLYSRARELDPVWIGKPDTIWDRYRWPILITSVGFLGLISVLIVLGISKQKLSHNHELLAESEKRWKFALEGGRSGVWDWNVESGSLYVSDRWYSMLGYSAGTWIMRNEDVQDLIHPDDAAIIARVMEEITRAFSVTYEVRV
ncbi:MAG: PAS domain-containing protein, partial [Spirochaeta sp.]